MKQKKMHLKRGSVSLAVLSSVIGLTLLTASACSVHKAMNQPDKKNLSVLGIGTPRSRVVAELGAPIWSGEKDGEKVDVFSFKQGYSKGAKAGRAFFHGAADVLTIGLWEVVGTPVETIASGSDVKVEVRYDHQDRVKVKTSLR